MYASPTRPAGLGFSFSLPGFIPIVGGTSINVGGSSGGSGGGISCTSLADSASGACALRRGLPYNQLAAALSADPAATARLKAMCVKPNGPWDDTVYPLNTPGKVAGVALAYASGGGSQGAEVVPGLNSAIQTILTNASSGVTSTGTAAAVPSSGMSTTSIVLLAGGAFLLYKFLR